MNEAFYCKSNILYMLFQYTFIYTCNWDLMDFKIHLQRTFYVIGKGMNNYNY